MNRNKIIGTVIVATLGHSVQGFRAYKIIKSTDSKKVLILFKGTKYVIRFFNSTSNKYGRTDFRSETIVSDAIDASFFAN